MGHLTHTAPGGFSAVPRTREDILAEVELLAHEAGVPPAVTKLVMLFGELDRAWREQYHELARATRAVRERDALDDALRGGARLFAAVSLGSAVVMYHLLHHAHHAWRLVEALPLEALMS